MSRTAAVALSCGLALTACSSGVEVTPAADATSAPCPSIAWPSTLGSLTQAHTTPQDPSVSAWGDPAVIARCGVPPLAPTTQDCVTVNGIDWVVRTLSDGSAATTYGRAPAIEVLVPAAHGPVPLLLPAFTDAAQSLASNGRHCT